MWRACAATLRVAGGSARLRIPPVSVASLRSSSTSVATTLARACERHPLWAAVGIATVKTAAADLIIQTQVEGCEEVDVRRVALFTVFGASYFGGFQYFLYVKCFSRWFDAERLSRMSLRAIFAEGGAARANWLKQMGFDLVLHGHFFFPLYYIYKTAITEHPSPLEGRPLEDVVASALGKYSENALDDWLAFWKIWIPGDIIVFGLVPMWARLPVNNAISFLYVLVLSFMRGAPDSAAIKIEAESRNAISSPSEANAAATKQAHAAQGALCAEKTPPSENPGGRDPRNPPHL